MKRVLLALGLAGILNVRAGEKDGKLDVIWSDVEGGAATLIVTPRGESILIDSGNPGGRDSQRIYNAMTNAGLSRLDHLITTHFHIDHFGGAAELAKLLPIGTVWDNGLPPTDPDGNLSNTSFIITSKPYREMKVEKRQVIQPGDLIPLKQAESGPKVSIRCLGTKQKFIEKGDGAEVDCSNAVQKAPDKSDNANSTVLLIEFGNFQMFVAGDLTWNVEKNLVCPKNLAGEVDVYQVTHHGLDVSNNALVVAALKPRVAVMSNGVTKGCGPESFATLKGTASIEAIYQIHRNEREDRQNNTDLEHIANPDRLCQAVPIKLSVAKDAANYTVTIDNARKHSKTYATK